MKLEHLKTFEKYDCIEDFYYCMTNQKLYIQLRYGYPTDAVVGLAREIIRYAHEVCEIGNIGMVCKEWRNHIDIAAIRDFETNLSYN